MYLVAGFLLIAICLHSFVSLAIFLSVFNDEINVVRRQVAYRKITYNYFLVFIHLSLFFG